MQDRKLMRWLALLLAVALLAVSCGGSDDTAGGDDGGNDEETVETGASFDDQAAAEQERTGDDDAADDAMDDDAADDDDAMDDDDSMDDDAADDDATDDDAADDDAMDDDAADDDAMAGGEIQTGGTLVISGPSDIANLDPITSSSFNTQYRVAPIYERLITFDSGPDIGYTAQVLKPELAESWDISDDLLTYTFTLRQGIQWHDVEPVNGREFVAGDVVATFNAILSEGHQAALLANVVSVEAPDDYTVVLSLSEPFAPLINNMASHFMWILPAESFEEGFDRTSTLIGTGPFMLADREVDVVMNYVRNPNYWQTDENGVQLPYLDGIESLVLNDTQQVIAAFKAGEIDIMTNPMAPELREQLMNDYPDAFFGQWIDAGMGQIGVNMDREPFNDIRVRQAISLAIDRDGMGDTIRGGGTVPSNVAPALADYALPVEERREYLYYDPERAIELLAEAGYPDGLDATLIATDRYGANYTAQTEWLVEDLKAVGINVTLEMLDYATYFGSRWPDVEYDLQFGPQTPFLEPDEWLRLQLRSDGARNWYNINDPELDAMLDEQLSIVDPAERAEAIMDIQRYVLENVLNPIPVWTYFTEWNYSPRVQNFYRHGSYGYAGIQEVWLSDG